ncbi:MAG TPA: exonuclease SbcCD subunit D C-terminal domain-containing protein [Haliangium sp.]|nr:exonuclease SbcCD subunit D C-terminal domain-containing protein [Haliangium sp.]
MRLLHTSDWHLGHTLHDVPRDHEHERFLSWLVETLVAEAVDALVITGDVFDTANPPAQAQARWYEFLAEARRLLPELNVVVIGGNHDSAARLDAPTPLLQAMNIHVIGAVRHVPAEGGRRLDVDRLLVPLTDARGRVAAHVAAVPFLRTSDLPRMRRGADRVDASTLSDDRPETPAGALPDALTNTQPDAQPDALAVPLPDPQPDPQRDPLIEGVRQVYAQVLDAARSRCEAGQALLATGHCYMVGTDISRLSERRILGGNQHALPVDIFPDDVAYVALGHLHKAQRVGGRENVRYAGSPLPLALDEARYRHQVYVVDLDGPALAGVRSVPVPRTVDVLRVPRRGAGTREEVLAELARLPAWDESSNPDTRPFLEVCVALARPEARLRLDVEETLQSKRPRLVKLGIEYTGHGEALAEGLPEQALRDLDPLEVFVRRYNRDHEGEPPAALVAAFDELLSEVLAARGETRPAPLGDA